LCSKTYAIKSEQQIQDRNRNSGNTEYFLNQGKDNIERNEENNNRNSKEIMHAIEVADQGDEEAAEFRFAAVKGMVTAHTHTMRATKGGKAKKAAKKKAKAEKKASKKAAKKGGKKGGKAGKPKPKPKPVPPAPKLPPVVKDKPVPKPPRKPKGLKVGTFTRKQLEQTQIEGEKSAEFEATYKQWMDALDDVCYHDLPATFYHFCKRIYNSGDLMVEMYLHGYEDYEICSAMSCPKNFFETNQ
tara:strand:- start:70 stop:798 length:729 start_codon:yes stop_codon:yes gene_type:complete